jgi:hypothetical protein
MAFDQSDGVCSYHGTLSMGLLRFGAKTVVFAPSKQIRNESAICA